MVPITNNISNEDREKILVAQRMKASICLVLLLLSHVAQETKAERLIFQSRKLHRDRPLWSRWNPLRHKLLVGLTKKEEEVFAFPLPQTLENVYNSIPKIFLPFTDVDITFTMMSALLFACIDYSSAHAIRTLAKWPLKESREIGGSLTTIFHSSVLVTGLFACLRKERYRPSCRLASHPLWFKEVSTALIQLCTGYMVYDALVQFIADRWVPGSGPVLSAADWMFLGHHAATSIYMTSARVIKAGHMSAMALMFLGEMTAPIMNVLRISNTALSLKTWSWLQSARPLIQYVFACMYVFIRATIGPICAVHLTYDMLFTKEGRENIPIALSLFWLIMVWGVMFGSIPWIKTALQILKGVDVTRLESG